MPAPPPRFGPGKDLERFGLCFLRRGGLEQSLAFGKHSRSAVHTQLEHVQVSWVHDCDLSRMDQKARSLESMESLRLGSFRP